MKTTRLIAAMLIFSVVSSAMAQTARQYFDDGINYLTATNLDSANLSFSNAVALAPTDSTNNFFYALTQLATLPDQSAASSFLSSLGIPETGRDLYDWTAKLPRSNRQLVAPVGVDANEFAAQLRTNVLITLTNAENNLAVIPGQRFSVELTQSETHLSEVTVDYGDVLMMQAILESAVFCSYTGYSWNTDAQLTDISSILSQESLASLVAAYPNAFTVTNTADLSAARAAFTNSINFYQAASQFIRVDRPPGAIRLFNLSTNEAQREFEFRETLTNILTSLTGPPVRLTANTNYTVSAAVFFSGTNSGPREAFPQFQDNEFLWNTFSDPTFGGVVGGLTQQNLNRFILNYVTATFDSPSVDLAGFYSLTNSVPGDALAQDANGNLYCAFPYDSFNPYYGPIGNGSIYELTTAGEFTNFYSFDFAPANNASPNALIVAGDHNLYGTTQGSGFSKYEYVYATNYIYVTNIYYESSNVYYTNIYITNVTGDYPVRSGGTIFKLATNGTLTTLSSFYYTNFYPPSAFPSDGGYTPSGIFVQGGDGNFYGTTVYGGYDPDYDSGTIFEITPAGVFSTVLPFFGSQVGSLLATTNGTIYLTSPNGGEYDYGFIGEILTNGETLTTYSFGSVQDEFGNPLDGSYPNSLVLGSNGEFYGTTEYGGSTGNGTVFEISSNGTFQTLASFRPGRTNASYPMGTLAEGAGGVFYGLASGGANGDGSIFEFNTNGSLQTIAWMDHDSGENPTAGLLGGVDGNFYGLTSFAGQFRHGTIFQLFDDVLQISPTTGLTASGSSGGPLTPSSETFVLTNAGTTSLNWSAGATVPWLTVLPDGGPLSPGASTTVTVEITSASDLVFGSYSGTIWFTNLNTGASQSRPVLVNAPGNGGFESGSFSDWTLGGDTSYTFIGDALNDPAYVHFGSDAALLGTSTGDGTLSQTISTVAGKSYLISFWLDNPVGGIPSLFRVSFGGQTLFSETNLAAFGWTNLQFTATASSSSTTLQFTFEQDYDYFGLDDIEVTASSGGPSAPFIQTVQLTAQDLQFTWSTSPSSVYQVQYKTNLNQSAWVDLGVPLTAASNSLTTNDVIIANTDRFYRVTLAN